MKKIISFIIITFLACVGYAQPCSVVDGLKPIQLIYAFNGNNPETTFPMIPSNWNRFYKLDGITGELIADGCAFPCCPFIAVCVCFVQGVRFRSVTPPCNTDPCGTLPANSTMPITDVKNTGSTWSQGSSWAGGRVPIISSSPAVVISKSLQIDANLTLPADHWLILTAGSTTLMSGQTITNNSQLRIYPAANFQNFGVLKGTGQVWGNFTNSGTLSPGNSPGKFSITGNYTATPAAVHEIEIAAANLYDTIDVVQNVSFTSGNAILGGALQVSLLNGFIPSLNDAFKIFSFASSMGNFLSTRLPVLPAGLKWTLHYNPADITLTVDASVLPLNFIEVNAFIRNEGIQIAWTTSNEINLINFEAEKSPDAVLFSKINSIRASGGVGGYGIFDAAPFTGNNYYRIKAVDMDGKFIYSAVRLVKFAKSKLFILYPNPAIRGNNIVLGLPGGMVDKIEIINAVGQIIYRNYKKRAGSITIQLPLAMASGQFVIIVTSGDKVETQKMQIR